MKNTICFWISAFIFLLASCSSGTQKVEEPLCPDVINLAENVKVVDHLLLSDAAARLDVVQLNTTGEPAMGPIKVVQVTESDIFIHQLADYRIMRFGRDGIFKNFIGKSGHGESEIFRPIYFWLDESAREVYVLAHGGIKVFGFDGDFVRLQTDELTAEMFAVEFAASMPVVYHLNQFFIERHMPFVKSTRDQMNEIWSVASVDENFDKLKLFENPAHKGWEQEIRTHSMEPPSGKHQSHPLIWKEVPNEYGLYGNELTVKFADADAIYRWDNERREFLPRYLLNTGEQKEDFKLAHNAPFDSLRFQKLRFIGYYPSKDYIYLKAARRGTVYGYQYDKQSHDVKCSVWEMGLNERVPGNPKLGYVMPESSLMLDNDFNGGIFNLEFRSQGRYWIDVIDLDASYVSLFIDDVRSSIAPQKQELLQVLEKAPRGPGKVLLIATLK